MWNNPYFRSFFYQAATLTVVCLSVWWLGDNAADNLARQGKVTGFGFLNDTAGFAINFHLIPYDETAPIWRVFYVGILNTLLISFLGIILATLLGFVIGVSQLSPNPLVRTLAVGYVELIRNVPLLLQIFFWYFTVLRPLPPPKKSLSIAEAFFLNNRGLYMPEPIATEGFGLVMLTLAAAVVLIAALIFWARARQRQSGQRFPVLGVSLLLLLLPPLTVFWAAGAPLALELPVLKGFNIAKNSGLWLSPELISLLLALSTYTAAFIAEIVRAGIQSVGQGQSEAYRALGLHRALGMRLVIIPQALRVIVPPLTNQYLNLTKNSSLAVAIAYPEIVSVFAGIVLNITGQEVEVIFMTMLFYLTLSLSIALLMNWFNRRFALIKQR